MPAKRARSAPATRSAILDAARAHFGEKGYERTTMRAVAADVGVDPAMVMRYFGTKDGLFAEAVEFDLNLPDLHGVSPDDVAAVLMPAFFRVWEESGTFLALLRASVTSPRAAETMLAVFAGQVGPTLSAMAVDNPEERAALVGSQILGLALTRYVLRIPPLVSMSQQDVAAWIAPTIARYLTGEGP